MMKNTETQFRDQLKNMKTPFTQVQLLALFNATQNELVRMGEYPDLSTQEYEAAGYALEVVSQKLYGLMDKETKKKAF